MRVLNQIVLGLLILIINISCGRDGKDGEVFLRFRAILTPLNFYIENPDIPIDFQYDVYYKTYPGSYPFTYTDHNGTSHPLPSEFGVVDIVVDSGESGALFSAGSDGNDIYIDLILLSTGAVIENYDYYTIASTLNYDE